MTEPGIYYPENLTGEQLDSLLAQGWYRMGQGIFTTNYIFQENATYRVYWLRYNLLQAQLGKSHQKIKTANTKFTVAVKPLEITDELEILYALYKTSITFDAANSVEHWLYMERSGNIYNTRIIEVRDNGLLIAAGIFDMGENSIAGIMNFYNPAYKKYSLGKYLMLQKMEYAKSLGMQWYYPGYIVYGYPKFDYKLFADKKAAELFIPELNGWISYNPALLQAVDNIINGGSADDAARSI